jgi:hypothetical protein
MHAQQQRAASRDLYEYSTQQKQIIAKRGAASKARSMALCARKWAWGAAALCAAPVSPRTQRDRGNRTRPGAEPERRARRPCARLPLVKPLSTLPARGAAEAKHNPQIPVHEAAVQQTHGGGRLAGPTAQGRRREDHGHHEREKPTLSGRRAVRKQHHTFGQASGSCRRPPSGVRDEWRGA